MTSTFLQKFGLNSKSALSQNLSEFFSFYGNYFNPSKLGLDGHHFFNNQLPCNDHLVALDLSNPHHNTASSAFRFPEVQSLFRKAYSLLCFQN